MPKVRAMAVNALPASRAVTEQFGTDRIVGSSIVPVAGYQFTLNAPSSAGAKVNLIALQAGIG
jgi:hypothetical protein